MSSRRKPKADSVGQPTKERGAEEARAQQTPPQHPPPKKFEESGPAGGYGGAGTDEDEA